LADVSKKTPFDNKVHGRVEATTDRMSAGHHMTGLSERSASVRHNRKDIENVLRGSEERFRLLVEGMKDYAIFMLDTEGRITSWNAGAQRINGYEAEEIIGQHFSTFYLPKDIERGHPEEELRLAQEQGRYEEEGLRVRKNGSRFWASVLITALWNEEGNLRGFSKVVRDVTARKEDEKKRREAEKRYRTLVEQIPAIVYIEHTNGHMTTLYDSPQIERMLGYPRDTYERDPNYWMKIIHPDDRARVLAEDRAAIGEEGRFSSEYRVLASDGRVVWVRDEAVIVRDQEGEPPYWQGFIFDITNRKEAEEAVRKSEASLAESQRIAHLGTWDWDVVTDEILWSEETFRIYGFEPNAFVPTFEKLVEIVHPDDRDLLREAIDDAFAGTKSYDFEHRIVRPSGEVRWVHRQGEVVRGEGGEPLRMIGTVHDITERKALDEKLKHQAFHDLLTNLPNRHLLVDRLRQALRRTSRRRGSRVAVLFMDLDNFKIVNDSIGHDLGDRILVAVSERLKEALRPEDTLTRFGGDEFVILLEDAGSPEEAVRVAERITDELRAPLLIEGRELFVRASIGIAFGDCSQKSSEDLLRDADTAMYQAKDDGRDYKVFDEAMSQQAIDRLELENDLRRAIEREEFVVHYQPIVNLQSGKLWGVEALVRWDHPERGLLDPDEFVPVAEESGLVVPLGEQVLGEACRRAAEWQKERPHTPPLVVSVNLSGRQLRRADLHEVIEQALKDSRLSASSLSLDITETVYISALDTNTGVLDRLKALGIRISIDDFGAGYSSLSYLKRLPADVLKIDKSFVRGLGLEIEDTAIVQTIVDLAHILGMEVVAEGVEVEEQETLLKEMDCDFAQGYYFSKPLPPEDVLSFLAKVQPS
jgi:diguanylate cyclase (GGDEF)-like protein/PAS domain S-box-containing protein